jgi:integrase
MWPGPLPRGSRSGSRRSPVRGARPGSGALAAELGRRDAEAAANGDADPRRDARRIHALDGTDGRLADVRERGEVALRKAAPASLELDDIHCAMYRRWPHQLEVTESIGPSFCDSRTPPGDGQRPARRRFFSVGQRDCEWVRDPDAVKGERSPTESDEYRRWPKDVRPYQARHSFALELGERGIDLADVSALLGHRDIVTTRTRYAPVLVSRLKRASEALSGRFSGWKPSSQDETIASVEPIDGIH